MKILPIAINNTDARGFTCEFTNDRLGEQLLVFRKAGTISGRHYHKGISATKNPEVFIVISGTCTFNWKHIDDTEIQSATVTGPTRIEVPPFIWHEVIPVTDCTCIELNSVAEHVADTFYL
jgi:oxalate decarboxylase/phosphoglucose isomerase-like protein (cupin superfamily)